MLQVGCNYSKCLDQFDSLLYCLLMLANCVRGYKNKHEWSDILGRASRRRLKEFLLEEGFWQISESNELDSQDKWTKKNW